MAAINKQLDKRLRRDAKNRCGYCQNPQELMPYKLEIEHLNPIANGGETIEENLWLACRMCNGFKATQTYARDPVKGSRVRLFDPRRQRWSRHFMWSEDGTRIIGRTACGRATVVALQLNHVIAVMVRRAWVAAGWYPPAE